MANKRLQIMHQKLSTAIKHWNYIAPLVKQPKSDREYTALVSQLDELLEIVGDDEEHRLMGLVDMLSHLITAYEERHDKMMAHSGIHALKFLMEAQHLSQRDLPEIGSQGVVSEILCGKRHLNVRQIKLLSKRFGVEASTFIDDPE